MTTGTQIVLYYWVFAFIWEAVALGIAWKKLKQDAEKHRGIMEFISRLKKSPSARFLGKTIFGIEGFVLGFILLAVASPFLFQFSLFGMFKRMVGWKSKLEKKAEAEISLHESKNWAENIIADQETSLKRRKPIPPFEN